MDICGLTTDWLWLRVRNLTGVRDHLGELRRGNAARNFLKTSQLAAISATTPRPPTRPTGANASPKRSVAPGAAVLLRASAAVVASAASTATGVTEKAAHRNRVFMGT